MWCFCIFFLIGRWCENGDQSVFIYLKVSVKRDFLDWCMFYHSVLRFRSISKLQVYSGFDSHVLMSSRLCSAWDIIPGPLEIVLSVVKRNRIEGISKWKKTSFTASQHSHRASVRKPTLIRAIHFGIWGYSMIPVSTDARCVGLTACLKNLSGTL